MILLPRLVADSQTLFCNLHGGRATCCVLPWTRIRAKGASSRPSLIVASSMDILRQKCKSNNEIEGLAGAVCYRVLVCHRAMTRAMWLVTSTPSQTTQTKSALPARSSPILPCYPPPGHSPTLSTPRHPALRSAAPRRPLPHGPCIFPQIQPLPRAKCI